MAVQGAQMPQPPQMPPPPPMAQGQPTPPPGQPWVGPLAPESPPGIPGGPDAPDADPDQIEERVNQLREAARKAAKKNAVKEAKAAAEELDELLTTGNFYEALAEFLIDLPIFPFAAIKGPDRADVLPGQVGERLAGAQAGPEDVLEPRLPLRPLLDANGAQRT